jgi:hypothetical protein
MHIGIVAPRSRSLRSLAARIREERRQDDRHRRFTNPSHVVHASAV